METLLAVVIPAAITLAGVLIGHAIKARADAVTGYAALVNDLQDELARLRQRLGEVEARLDREKAAWTVEREALLSRIAELEADNRRMEAQMNALRQAARGRE